jgi:hypothetical protein
LVSSKVLSWDAEERREKCLGQLKGVVTGYWGKMRKWLGQRKRAVTGYWGKKRKMAGSAQACCHGILRKGEKSDLVSSRVLSRDTEIRREKWFGQLKGGVGTGYWGKERKVVWSAQGFYHGILRKGDKSGWGKLKPCCHGILRKGEKSGLVSTRVLSRDTEEKREKWLAQLRGVVMGYWKRRDILKSERSMHIGPQGSEETREKRLR